MNLLNKQSSRGAAALDPQAVSRLLPQIPLWSNHLGTLTRSFAFDNYYQTIAFVNALAWISHQQDHHPELQVSYQHCVVRYTTHSAGALTENDFICAAKADALVDPSTMPQAGA